MKTLCVLSFVVILFNISSGQNDNPHNFTRKSLPALSMLDNMKECLEKPDNIFYSIDIELHKDDSPFSQYLQDYSMQKSLHYNYSNLHRAICSARCGLNRTNTINNDTVVTTLKSCLNGSFYNEYGLQVENISIFYVKSNEEDPTTVYDKIVATFVVVVVLLNVGVSIYLFIFPEYNNKGKSWMTAFSIQKNWKDLSHGGRGDGNLFKCIEALRFHTNMVTLGLHAAVFICSGLIINAEFVEDSIAGYKKMFANLRIVMQTFFVIGGFLMAHKILGMIENQNFSWKSIPMLSINRYVRIMPTLMTMVALTATWIPKMGSGPLWERVVTYEGQMCKKNWWHVASLWQNFFPFEDECLPQTWYVGADWQLFHISLLILIITWKLPKLRTGILVGTSVVSILVVFLQSYFMDLKPIRTSITPELIRTRFKGDNTIFYGYFSPQCNWAGYHIGVLAAYFYRKSLTSNWDLKNSLTLKALYILSVPIIVACIFMGSDLHHRKASTLEAAVFNSLNQNLYAAANAVIILGSMYKMNDLYVNVLEWGPFQSLGRLSYCSLLIHSGILRTYGGHQLGFYATDYNFIMLFAAVLCTTYSLAVPLYIFVEAPAYALQRILLNPQKELVVNDYKTNLFSNGNKPHGNTESKEKVTNVSEKVSGKIDKKTTNDGYKVLKAVSEIPNGIVKHNGEIANLSKSTDILTNEISLRKENGLLNGSFKKMESRFNLKELNMEATEK